MSKIKPGDYISYISNDSVIRYGILLENPHQEDSIRRYRSLASDIYLIRCYHEEPFKWHNNADHYADKLHFDTAEEETQVKLIIPMSEHQFSIGDCVYSTEFCSMGIIHNISSDHNYNCHAVAFYWNLNDEDWIQERSLRMHSCNGYVFNEQGFYCVPDRLIWIPKSPFELTGYKIPEVSLKQIENPLRAIFKKSLRRRNYG